MKRLLVVAIFLTSIMVSCQQEAADISPNQEIVVTHARAAAVGLSKGRGELVVNINDSRCPTNADCLLPGQATVRAQLRAGADSSRTVNLCLGGCYGPEYRFRFRDSAAVTLKGRDYWLYLLAVDPYPITFESNNAPKTATMRLTAR
jgi:hypothetical protein